MSSTSKDISHDRVISLLPAATDILIALGAANRLVAVTHECSIPTDVTAPRVTTTPICAGTAGAIDQQVRDATEQGANLFTLDEARIAESRPDLIITQALCDVCAVSEHDVRALAARLTPSPTIVTLSGTTFDGVFADIAHVGHALGLTSESEELLAGLTVRLRRVQRHVSKTSKPRVAVIEWTDPIYAAGHWVPELISLAGGIDVLAAPGEHSTTRTVAQLRDADPDVLIFAQCGYDAPLAAAEAATLLETPEWAWARHRVVWAIDANRFTSRPGPEIVTGVELAAAMLHANMRSHVRSPIAGLSAASIQRVL